MEVSTNEEESNKTTLIEENTTVKDTSSNSAKSNVIDEISSNTKNFIKVIKITTYKKDIYKSYLDDILSIDNRVTLCRDDKNLIEIFVGPFDNELERNTLTKSYINRLKIDAEAFDFTEEEYNKRCNY